MQKNDGLKANGWISFASSTADSSGANDITDNQPGNARFYRAVRSPP